MGNCPHSSAVPDVCIEVSQNLSHSIRGHLLALPIYYVSILLYDTVSRITHTYPISSFMFSVKKLFPSLCLIFEHACKVMYVKTILFSVSPNNFDSPFMLLYYKLDISQNIYSSTGSKFDSFYKSEMEWKEFDHGCCQKKGYVSKTT